MRAFVKGLVSISMIALVGLAGCGREASSMDTSMDGPVLETQEALAGAADCSAFIASHINWVMGQNNCGGYYGSGYVDYQIVTHQSSGLVSINEGFLDQATEAFSFYDPFTKKSVTVPATLFSNRTYDGLQSFSDRKCMATIPGEAYPRSFGFDPRYEDQVKVTLSDDGKMILKLVTWGGAEITVQPTECMHNLMYGFGDGVLYSIKLTDLCTPG